MKRARRIALRVLRGVGLGILVLVLVLVVNTLRQGRVALPSVPPPPNDAVDATAVAAHLAQAIRFKTVSHEDPKDDDYAEVDGMRAFFEATYPKLHATLTREVVGGHGLVYTWAGSDASLRPVLLAAHQDVVPVEPGTEGAWTHPPFAGAVADDFVWGRGARDDKASLVTILEAVEALVGVGFKPKRTVVLAFGFDEEVGGALGAKTIAASFAAKGTRFDYVLDEGGAVVKGVVEGVARPLALVGLTEKGFVTTELTVSMPTGHSSMPPPQTSVGILAAAIDRLERQQMPPHLTPTSRRFFETLAPELPFTKRLAMSNLWLLEPLVLSQLTKQQATNATVRTTTAPTIFQAGVKENVLPSSARALVNFRILPGDSVDGVVAHVREVVADERVVVKVAERMVSEPPPESSADSRAYRLIETTIRQFFPEVLVVPNVVVGATDARNYAPVADAVYHFGPFVLGKEDLSTIHGTNERFRVDDLAVAVRFYEQLLRDGGG
jgi:carboxypeptidase PM20D1